MSIQVKPEESRTLKLVSERAEAVLKLIDSKELEQELANIDNHFNVRDIVAAALWKTDLMETILLRKIYEAIIKVDMKDPTSVEKWAEEINHVSQHPIAVESMSSKKNQTMSKEEIATPERYVEKMRQTTDAVDIVMEEKELRQNTSEEEKERQKRRRNKEDTKDTEDMSITMDTTIDKYVAEEIKTLKTNVTQQDCQDIIAAIRSQEEEEERRKKWNYEIEESSFMEAPLEQSIWSPANRDCSKKLIYAAKIPAYNVPGSSKEERTKFVKRLLITNKHVIEVKKVFKKGNA